MDSQVLISTCGKVKPLPNIPIQGAQLTLVNNQPQWVVNQSTSGIVLPPYPADNLPVYLQYDGQKLSWVTFNALMQAGLLS